MKTRFVLVACLAITLLFNEIVSAQKPLYTAPLGVQTYTFRRSMGNDPAKVLDTIKMLGFTEVEGGGGRIAPEDFKKLCDERGISIPSTGADYGQLVSAPDSVVMRAKALGAKYVMCAWIPHENGVLTLENAKKAVDDFNKAGKFLKDNGLILCYHAHGYEFQPYEDGTLLDYIVKNTNPEYVSFEMDIFWIHFGGGDPAALLKKYGNRWKLMHVKDLRKGAAINSTGSAPDEDSVAVGQGQIDWPAVLKAAKAAGIEYYFIEDEAKNAVEQIPQSLRYIESLKF